MIFRRDNVGIYGCIFMMFSALFLVAFQFFEGAFNFVISVIAFLFVLVSICSFNSSKEYIYIDERVIFCKSKDGLLWSFDWNDIDHLVLVRSKWPRLYIVLKGSDDSIISLNEKELYIKYRYIVKKALKRYCTKKRNSGWYNIYYTGKSQSGDGSLSLDEKD